MAFETIIVGGVAGAFTQIMTLDTVLRSLRTTMGWAIGLAGGIDRDTTYAAGNQDKNDHD